MVKVLALSLASLALAALIAMGFNFFAHSPQSLRATQPEKLKFRPVHVAEVQETPESPPPPESSPSPAEASLLATLTPDPMTGRDLDFGQGISFGSGGGGPAIGGHGGFGESAESLVEGANATNRPARLRHKQDPEYPLEARRRNISGHVLLKILINVHGQVEQVQVESANPPGFFEQAALQAVRGWQFEPAWVNGKIQAAWTLQKMSFGLN